MGVGPVGGGDDGVADEMVKGLGAGAEGESIRSTWACTSARVVVTGASATSVIPDHLRTVNKSDPQNAKRTL
jgi:hypothetical protein